ncbi:MAG: hypothetical protein V8K32_12475 [Candidatus Electrothrix gigas]
MRQSPYCPGGEFLVRNVPHDDPYQQKILSTLLVVLGATFCTYTLMHFAPGDPALEIAVSRYGGQYEVDQATVEWIRESEGLDKPLYLQYLYWLRHVSPP